MNQAYLKQNEYYKISNQQYTNRNNDNNDKNYSYIYQMNQMNNNYQRNYYPPENYQKQHTTIYADNANFHNILNFPVQTVTLTTRKIQVSSPIISTSTKISDEQGRPYTKKIPKSIKRQKSEKMKEVKSHLETEYYNNTNHNNNMESRILSNKNFNYFIDLNDNGLREINNSSSDINSNKSNNRKKCIYPGNFRLDISSDSGTTATNQGNKELIIIRNNNSRNFKPNNNIEKFVNKYYKNSFVPNNSMDKYTSKNININSNMGEGSNINDNLHIKTMKNNRTKTDLFSNTKKKINENKYNKNITNNQEINININQNYKNKLNPSSSCNSMKNSNSKKNKNKIYSFFHFSTDNLNKKIILIQSVFRRFISNKKFYSKLRKLIKYQKAQQKGKKFLFLNKILSESFHIKSQTSYSSIIKERDCLLMKLNNAIKEKNELNKIICDSAELGKKVNEIMSQNKKIQNINNIIIRDNKQLALKLKNIETRNIKFEIKRESNLIYSSKVKNGKKINKLLYKIIIKKENNIKNLIYKNFYKFLFKGQMHYANNINNFFIIKNNNFFINNNSNNNNITVVDNSKRNLRIKSLIMKKNMNLYIFKNIFEKWKLRSLIFRTKDFIFEKKKKKKEKFKKRKQKRISESLNKQKTENGNNNIYQINDDYNFKDEENESYDEHDEQNDINNKDDEK